MNDLNLDQRDRLSIIFAATLVICVLGLLWYVPTGPRADYLSAVSNLEDTQNDLQMTQLLKLEEEQRLETQQELMAYLDKRPESFNFFTFVDRKLFEQNLKSRASLEQFRPRDASPRMPMVNLKLDNVGLKELVGLFKELYASENLIAMYKLNRLQPDRGGNGLSVDVTLITLKREG